MKNLRLTLTLFFLIIVAHAVCLPSVHAADAANAVNVTKEQAKTEQKTNQKSDKENAEVKNLQFFDSIHLSSLGTLHIKQSNEPSFTIEADKKVLPLITAYVKDKVLYIDMKQASENTRAKIDYYLLVKKIKTINTFSDSNIDIEDFSGDELNLNMSGFGEAKLLIHMKKFMANIDGGGKIMAKGSAEQQTITIRGAGEFHGTTLEGKSATVTINGSGMVNVGVSETLNVNMTGEGSVHYCKEPKITKEIKGKGTVSPSGNEC